MRLRAYNISTSSKKFELTVSDAQIDDVKINSSTSAYQYARDIYTKTGDIEIFESFYIIMLNRRNHTYGYAKISQGGISGTVVDTKLLAKYAVEALANAIILVHNHPSGNCEPSTSDLELTTKIVEGMKLLDIKVLDHIIVSSKGYYSFADNSLL